jgi:hypothetical protein
MLAKDPAGNTSSERLKKEVQYPRINSQILAKKDFHEKPQTSKSLEQKEETPFNTSNEIKRKTSVNLINYKQNKKMKIFLSFLIHCGAIFFIGLFSKYAFSEEIVNFQVD